MQAVKDKTIPLILQLIKSDLTYEDSATVSYEIYNPDLSSTEVSSTSITWNSTLNGYTGSLAPSAGWSEQEAGNYMLVWSISDTDYFASTMMEELIVLDNVDSDNTISNVKDTLSDMEDTLEDVEDTLAGIGTNVISVSGSIADVEDTLEGMDVNLLKVLGLVHQNINIDNATYDGNDNLASARLRIYSESGSVGTDNDVLATYQITSAGIGPGKFSTWKQVEV